MRWMMYRWWCEGGGDRAYWVIESVFLRSPDKGFWACLGDIPPDMLRRPETWVSLCNLMLKLCGILRSSAILGSDSPQSNNRKDHFLWVTPFIPREKPNVKHAIAGYLRLPRPTSAPALMRVLHWLRCWAEEPGYATGNPPEDNTIDKYNVPTYWDCYFRWHVCLSKNNESLNSGLVSL